MCKVQDTRGEETHTKEKKESRVTPVCDGDVHHLGSLSPPHSPPTLKRETTERDWWTDESERRRGSLSRRR